MAAPSVPPGAASRKSALDLPGVLLFFGAAVLAFLLYRPDTNAPFEIIDFSETLPFLTDGSNFGERLRGLANYYLQHGRAAFALSAALSAKWTLFEWWTPGWQWIRYVVGLTVVALAWHLFRALGASKSGATFGASLFIVSETVAPGWLRPSVNEPFGTVLLLSASLLGCRYQGSGRPGRLAVGIAVLLAAMIVVKETLVAATFFPIALALCLGPDRWLRTPALSRRNRLLIASSAVAIAIASLPVLWALTRTVPGGYAQQYDLSGSLLSNAVFGVLPALVPFTPVSQPPGIAATVADVFWLVLLMLGWRARRVDPVKAHHDHLLALIAMALPLARVLVYLPWPLQYPYYSIPYFIGTAVVAAIGATRAPRRVAFVIAPIVLLYAAGAASAHASRYFALRRLTDSLVRDLHAMTSAGSIDSILMGVPRPELQTWSSLGPTLSRFGAATSRALPPIREVSCTAIKELMSAPPPRVAVSAFQHHCGIPQVQTGPVEFVKRFDFDRFRARTDTLRVLVVSSMSAGSASLPHVRLAGVPAGGFGASALAEGSTRWCARCSPSTNRASVVGPAWER